ncbi:MAG: hypothetical protein RXQ22_09810 [Sulfolobus sp.]
MSSNKRRIDKNIIKDIFDYTENNNYGYYGYADTRGWTNNERRRLRRRLQVRAWHIWVVACILVLLLDSLTFALMISVPNPIITNPSAVNYDLYINIFSYLSLFALLGTGGFIEEPFDKEDLIGILLVLIIIFIVLGVLTVSATALTALGILTGFRHPFSPGNMSVVSVVPNNSTKSLYLVELPININGIPLNVTLVIKNVTATSQFGLVTCSFYNSNIGQISLPLTIRVIAEPGLLPAPSIPTIRLYLLCNNTPTKAVLLTNYGNLTFFLAS